MSAHKSPARISDDRIRNLADGVFSIAMTLMVLSLKPPGDGPILPQLEKTMPRVAIYFLAFIQLGVIWIAHTFEVAFEKDANRWYSWCNLLLLMFVALLPFSVQVLGDHPDHPISSLVYGLNMVLIDSSLILYWFLVWSRLPDGTDRKLMRTPLLKTSIALSMFAVAIPLAFLNTHISFAIFVIVPTLYIFPSRSDWERNRKVGG